MVQVSSTMLPLGTPLPAFSLPDPDGRLHGTADAGVAGAPALLVAFVCNHCPYVRHVAPELGRLAKQWSDAGLAVLAVNSNDTDAYPDDGPEPMRAFAAANGWGFPYLVDESQEVALTYRAACTPDFFLFDGDRRLAYRGRLDASRPGSGVPVTGEELGAAVDAVLAGRPVEGDQLPSIGCNIKWKRGNEPDWF
jgi:thiol-disulfide isomerase/thioredoxin